MQELRIRLEHVESDIELIEVSIPKDESLENVLWAVSSKGWYLQVGTAPCQDWIGANIYAPGQVNEAVRWIEEGDEDEDEMPVLRDEARPSRRCSLWMRLRK